MAKNIVTGFLSMVGRRIATFAIMFVGTPIMVRVLEPSGYGNYAFALSVFSILMVFVSSGVTEGVQKYVGETERRPGWRDHVAGFYLRLAALLALLGSVFLVVAVWSGLLDWLLDTEFETVFYLLAAMVITTQFMEYGVRALRGLGVEKYSESLRVLNAPLFLITGVGLAALGYGVVGMIIGHVFASLFVALIGLFLVSRRIDLTTALSPGRLDVPRRELLSFNAWNILLVLLTMSLYHVDVMMIRVFVDSESTGYYKAALAVAEFLWVVPVALQSMFVHSMSNLWSSGDNETVNRIAARTTRYAMLFSILLATGFAALGGRFLPLYYGPEYSQAAIPLLILLPGAVGFAVARPIFGIAQGKGDLKTMVLATGGAATLNVVLNAVLIPRYGMTGAAVATSVGYLSMLVFHVLSARHIGFYPLSDIRPVRLAATAILGSTPILFLATQIESDIVAFTVIPPLGAALFFGLSVRLGALDQDELIDILNSMPAPIQSAVESVWTRLPVSALFPSRPGQ